MFMVLKHAAAIKNLLHDFIQQVEQTILFSKLVNKFNMLKMFFFAAEKNSSYKIRNLCDVVVCRQLHRTNLQMDWIDLEIGCQISDLFWPSGREHQCLTVRLENTGISKFV